MVITPQTMLRAGWTSLRAGAESPTPSAPTDLANDTFPGLLEIHHREPYAQGGPASAENLALYCRTHNALAAEQDFGREYMNRRSGRDLG